jgi:hypothetical protein
MLKLAKLGIAIAAVLALIVPAAYAGVPDATQSFYVPQSGSVTTPTEGLTAARNFRSCPNNDGGSSFPLNARIKVVVLDVNGNPIVGIAAADICVLFNGGTSAQGFSGVGADSVIANSTWNQSPLCPDVRCVAADAPTNASGVTYITFAGALEANPGVTVRNANRKWGHYDTELPVFVLGFKIPGRLQTVPSGAYTLRVKSMDLSGGLGATLNAGESVAFGDYLSVVAGITTPSPLNYWRDLNSDNLVSTADVLLLAAHYLHDCTHPNNP